MNDDQPEPECVPPSEREKIAGKAGIAKARETLRNLENNRER